MSNSVICTLFENHYHHGVAALANSLYAHNFRGTLYAAYRGTLPDWAEGREDGDEGHSYLRIGEGFTIHFALQDTGEMLANIKPQIIRQVWKVYGGSIDMVFYIDCDIVIKSTWKHFEEWCELGVALCEDVNSPLHPTHPIRLKWKRYYGGFDIDYNPKDTCYVNGGFVGIHGRYIKFNDLWDDLQEKMKQYTGKQDQIGIANRWHLFHYMDQDALNVAKDLYPDISIMEKKSMDFDRLGYVMSHAAGPKKPWKQEFLRGVVTHGIKPSFADKSYWDNVSYPIRLYSDAKIRRKRLAIKAAIFIARFFTRI